MSGGGEGVSPVKHPHDAFGLSLVGTIIGGRYAVDGVIGRGGMGVVVSAHYADLDQRVAIKVMFPEHASDVTLAKRFMREAKLAAKLRSPNLVRVTDVGTLRDGVPYLVMELLTGHDLHKELMTRGPLPLEDAADYVLQAATGLAELHALGIVHRDLKNGNLFLAQTTSGLEVKVLDYGISKDPDATTHLTGTDALMGTPSHMSPEQIKTPKEVDARSDIWSLGVIFYELLTKQMPYDLDTATVGELFGLVLFSDPVPLRERRPDLPAGIDAIVMKCLRREPGGRWSNVGELAAALAPFARPESAYRVVTIARLLARAPAAAATPPVGSGAAVKVASATIASGPKRSSGGITPPAAPVTAPESLGTEERASARPSSSKKVVLGLAAATLLGGGLAVALRSGPTGRGPAPSAVPEVSARAEASIRAAAVAPSAVSLPLTSSVASSEPAPRPTASVAPRRGSPTTLGGARPAQAPPRASASTPPPQELILDRK